MYLNYLIINRKKSKLLSILFFKNILKRIYNFLPLLAYEFKRLCLIQKGVTFGDFSVVSNKCKLKGELKNLQIGSNTYIGNAEISLHGAVNIGSNTVINDDVNIITASHNIDDVNWKQFNKKTHIGDFVWIATGAVILPGVKIDDFAVVGAYAVVTKDVGSNEVVTGNPAKLVKLRKINKFDYSPVRFVAAFDAWLN